MFLRLRYIPLSSDAGGPAPPKPFHLLQDAGRRPHREAVCHGALFRGLVTYRSPSTRIPHATRDSTTRKDPSGAQAHHPVPSRPRESRSHEESPETDEVVLGLALLDYDFRMPLFGLAGLGSPNVNP